MDPEDSRLLERYYRDKLKAEAKDKLVEVAQVCNCIGELLSKYGRYEDAIKEHTQEKRLCEALQDRIGEAVACRKIGECHCALGQYSQALELQKQHLTVARECQDNLEEQRAWATIGRTYLCKAEGRNLMEASLANKHAEKAFFKALEACEKVKTSVQPAEYMAMKCRVLLNLGLVYDNRDDVTKSTDIINRAISLAEKHRLDPELLMCQSSLMTVWQNDRKYPKALRAGQQGLKLAQKLRDKIQERDILILMASVHVGMGNFLTGKHCLKKAHKLKTDSDDDKATSMFKAVNKMLEAHNSLEGMDDDSNRSEHYEVFADCLTELGLYKDAIDYYSKVLTSAHLSMEKKAAIYVSLARTYADARNYESAIFYYKKELEIRQSNPEQACRTQLNIAELEELNGGRYSAVLKIFMDAFYLAKKAKHVRLMLRSLKSLMVVQRLCEQWKHLEETEKTTRLVRKKHGLAEEEGSDSVGDVEEEEDEEDSEEARDSMQRSETPESDLSLSDLTVSEGSSDEEGHEEIVIGKKRRNDIAKRNEKGETPLHRACIEGNLKKVKSLIAKGHPINLRDHCGWIPLHEAANHGHEAVVEVLLENGAWINDRGGEMCGGVTPLIDAANCGNLEVMSILMRHGASLVMKDDNGNTPLDCLKLWHSTNADDLPASEVFKFHEVEKLLGQATGKSYASTHVKTTKSHIGSDQTQTGSKTAVVKYDHKAPNSSRFKLPVCKPSASATAVHTSQPGTPRVRDKYKRLPDLEEVLAAEDEGEEDSSTIASTSSSYSLKDRLILLKEKRLFNNPIRKARAERSRAKADCDGDTAGKSASCDVEDSEDLHVNPRKDSSLSTNAVDSYRRVMDSMRSSARSRNELDEEKENCDDTDNDDDDDDDGGGGEQKKNAPYLVTDEDVGDDWLIDDLGPLPKGKGRKRSHAINILLSGQRLRSKSTKTSSNVKRARYGNNDDPTTTTASSVPETSCPSPTFSKNSATIASSVPETSCPSPTFSKNSGNLLDKMFGFDSDSGDSDIVIQGAELQRGRHEVSNPIPVNSQIGLESREGYSGRVAEAQRSADDFWESDGDDDLLATSLMYESYVFNDNSNLTTTSQNKLTCSRSDQDSHVSSSSTSADVSRQQRVVSNALKTTNTTHTHTSTTPQNHSVISSVHSHPINNQQLSKTPSHTSEIVSKSDSLLPGVKKIKYSVKVNVEGKILLVPVYEGDENKTIAWLAQQASERYFSIFFVNPRLTLRTPDGMILGPSDPVSSVMNYVQELHAVVKAWTKQSAAERYEKVCEAFYEDCRDNIKSLLQNIGGLNNKLDLTDLNLRMGSLLTIFQAIEGERGLVELKLGGNRMSDSGIPSLTKLLSSLTNLKVLVLDSNELTLEGLGALASFVQTGSGLQSVTDLSLNYNCLTNAAEASVKLLLKCLPNLTSLRLGACYLNSEFFSPGLIRALSESSVVALTLSENQFSREIIHQVVQSSITSNLKEFDLSHSLSNDDQEPVIDALLRPLEGGVLQSLSLAGCHLSKSDVLVVNRLPVLIPSLGQLNVSHNRNFDNTSLQKLIGISTCAQSKLHTITVRGCSIRSPLGDELMDCLKLKLESSVPLTKVVFSCRGLTTAESDLLSQIWMDKWDATGKVKASGTTVDLSVLSSRDGRYH